jgi:hypothetical protein
MTWRTFQRTDGISHSSGGTAATGIKKDGPAHSSAWAGRRAPRSAASFIAGVQCVGKASGKMAVWGQCCCRWAATGRNKRARAAATDRSGLPPPSASFFVLGRPAWWPPRHKAKPGADKSLRNGLFLRSGFSEGSDQPSRSKSKLLRSTIYGCPCLI